MLMTSVRLLWRGLGVPVLALTWLASAGCWGHTPMGQPGEVYTLLGQQFRVETVAYGLRVPWGLAWMPDGRMLITERTGRLMVVQPGERQAHLLTVVQNVHFGSEQGLLGIALSPAFATDRLIYLSYTTRDDAGRRINRVVRFCLRDSQLTAGTILVDNLPANEHHNGLPLHFGPDGKLYAGTGEAIHQELSQDMRSLAGKILRLNPDGSVPADNPFANSPIWALGIRDCQGFDWQPATGLMLATDHGPTFPLDGWGGDDEVNFIQPGHNYGWPLYHGPKTAPGYEPSLVHWNYTQAPSGAAFYNGQAFPGWQGRFFFAGLRGEALWCLTIARGPAEADAAPACGADAEGMWQADRPQDDVRVVLVDKVLYRQFGRLRCVAVGPDGYLYLSTSNRDGHGQPGPADDRVLRLIPVAP